MPTGTSGGNRETLLLVEDNDEARTALRRALAWHGYRIVEARDAREAEEAFLAAASPIDLLVADVVLPDRSGVELAGRLAEQRPGLRVLFLSGYAREELSLAANGLGPSAFVEKPVTIRRLGEEVRRLLDETPVTPLPPAGDGGSPAPASERSLAPRGTGWP